MRQSGRRPPPRPLTDVPHGNAAESHQPFAVELQEAEEPSDDLQGAVAVSRERPKAGSAGTAKALVQQRRLLADADGPPMRVVDRHELLRAWSQRPSGQGGEIHGPKAQQNFWKQAGIPWLKRHLPGITPGLGREQATQMCCGLLVGPVLQKTRKKQVPSLQQRQILLILDVCSGQQSGGLEVEQGGGDHKELRRLAEVPAGTQGADMRDEIIGHFGQGNIGDVELMLADQPEEEIERAFEHIEVDVKARLRNTLG